MLNLNHPTDRGRFVGETCGDALPSSEPAGVCARCLLRELTDEFWEAEALPAGTHFGAYEIIEVINRGGMGVVFRARQETPRREVALKVLATVGQGWGESRQRFHHEVQLLAELDHPCILPIFDSGEENGRPWFSMKLALGGSLAEAAPGLHHQWQEIARLMITISEAVHHAHQRGIIHRDLKPSNILFDENRQAFVADFGLARWANADHDPGLTQSQAVLGSPAYIAPEVAVKGSRHATILSDVYGLGGILYELLTGGPPFRGESAAAVLRDVLQEEPAFPATLDRAIPKDLGTIALKALSKDPSRRYESAAALAAELQRWLDGKPIQARPARLAEKIWMYARRHPVPAGLSLALLVALVGSAVSLTLAYRRVAHALEETQAARSSADARVAYMVTELPDLLEPVGRLDLLDGVFANVASYYDHVPPSQQDSLSLARRALFLDSWSEVLWKRGQRGGRVDLLRQAVEVADQSLAKPNPPIDSWLAAATVRGAYAEMLVVFDRNEEADRSLREATELVSKAKSKFGDDQRLALALADLERQEVDALQAKARYREAMEKARELAPVWRSLTDRISPENGFDRATVQHCRRSCQALFFSWSEAADRADAHPEAVVVLLENQQRSKGWAERHADDQVAQLEYADACAYLGLKYLHQRTLDIPRAEALLRDNLQIIKGFADKDPGNLYYVFQSGLADGNFARIARVKGDLDDERKWLKQSMTRFASVQTRDGTLDSDVLVARTNALQWLAANLVKSGMKDEAASCFEEAARVQLERTTNRASSWAEHERFNRTLGFVRDGLREAGAPERMAPLCRELLGKMTPFSHAGKAPSGWLWTESQLHRRLAEQLLEQIPIGDEAVSETEHSLSLRLKLLSEPEVPPELVAKIADPVLSLLKKQAFPLRDDTKDMLRRMLDAIPMAVRKNRDGEWRADWAEVFVAATASDADRDTLRMGAEAERILFTDDGGRPFNEREIKARQLLSKHTGAHPEQPVR